MVVPGARKEGVLWGRGEIAVTCGHLLRGRWAVGRGRGRLEPASRKLEINYLPLRLSR